MEYLNSLKLYCHEGQLNKKLNESSLDRILCMSTQLETIDVPWKMLGRVSTTFRSYNSLRYLTISQSNNVSTNDNIVVVMLFLMKCKVLTELTIKDVTLSPCLLQELNQYIEQCNPALKLNIINVRGIVLPYSTIPYFYESIQHYEGTRDGYRSAYQLCVS